MKASGGGYNLKWDSHKELTEKEASCMCVCGGGGADICEEHSRQQQQPVVQRP